MLLAPRKLSSFLAFNLQAWSYARLENDFGVFRDGIVEAIICREYRTRILATVISVQWERSLSLGQFVSYVAHVSDGWHNERMEDLPVVVTILRNVPYPREGLVSTLFDDLEVPHLYARYSEVRNLEFDSNGRALVHAFLFCSK